MAINLEQKKEIELSRDTTHATYRVTSPGIEEILYKTFPVLDHGFIRVIDYMGDDSSIVQAARVSYGKGTRKVNEDKGLIQYLMRHQHTTPFEMCDIKFHIKLPIFVARQWIRHRTASVNEYSARYSILGNEFYLPERQHLAAQSTTNRQGRDKILATDEARRVLEILEQDAKQCYAHYEEMLNHEDPENLYYQENRDGLSRELARMNLTLNFYTEWYWKTNLHNLFNFVRLRADQHAQYEIRVYAETILEIIKKWVPYACEAFIDYRLNSISISSKGIKVLKDLINGKKPTQESSGMNKREWREFCTAFELDDITEAA